jgi:2-amino-4-hydroxy-6-hydroxymethyldihydropteridine diphosphokinase
VTLAYVGIGANLEQPRQQVERALHELEGLPATRVLARSSLYRSEPVGHAAQPQFVNAVAALETALVPEALLAGLLRLEDAHGRKRSFPNAPRTLDLDLLLYGDRVIRLPGLSVPHPRMHERAFVLKPLLEIAPAIVIPGVGPAEHCLAACTGQAVERID